MGGESGTEPVSVRRPCVRPGASGVLGGPNHYKNNGFAVLGLPNVSFLMVSVIFGFGCVPKHKESVGLAASGLEKHKESVGLAASGFQRHEENTGSAASGLQKHKEKVGLAASGLQKQKEKQNINTHTHLTKSSKHNEKQNSQSIF